MWTCCASRKVGHSLSVLILLGSASAAAQSGPSIFSETLYASLAPERDRALRTFFDAPVARPLSGESRVLGARMMIDLSRYREALATLDQLTPHLGHLEDLLNFMRAEAFEGLGEYRAAAHAYDLSARAQPTRWADRARERQAQALSRANDHHRAHAVYSELIASYPNHPRRAHLEYLRALAVLATGNHGKALSLLRQIWVQWPTSRAAQSARAHLNMHGPARDKSDQLATPEHLLLERARRLRAAKDYEAAISQFRALTTFPSRTIDWEVAYTLRRAGRIREAADVYQRLLSKSTGSRRSRVRRHLARALAHLGTLDRALALYEEDLGLLRASPSRKSKRLSAKIQISKRSGNEVAALLIRHGKYKEALAIRRQIIRLDRAARRRRSTNNPSDLSRSAWLNYRAGRYAPALRNFAKISQRRNFLAAYAEYWSARIHQEAGRLDQANKLYRNVMRDHGGTYYGYLARSRLVEQGQLVLETRRCESDSAKIDGISVPTDTQPMDALDRLHVKFENTLPHLGRARSLWAIGLHDEAQNELRLGALTYLQARSYSGHRRKSRPPYRFRTDPLRIWAGSPYDTTDTKRVTAFRLSYANLPKATQSRFPAVFSAALAATQLSYLGWKISRQSRDRSKSDERIRYPKVFERYVLNAASRFQVDPHLIWAIMRTESAYRPDAISRVRAAGLMQLMPNTARRLAAEIGLVDFQPADVFDPETNITLATSYLAALITKFRGQIPLVAAAYNGGPHNVARWLDYRGNSSNLDEFVEEIPFRESKRYAKKIVKLIGKYNEVHCSTDALLVPAKLDTSYAAYPAF